MRPFLFALLMAWIPATAQDAPTMPKLKVGEAFSYTTQVEEGSEVKEPLASYKESRGTALVAPLPNSQTVKVTGEEACGEHTCLAVEAKQDMPPYLRCHRGYQSVSKTIKALIDLETGDVLRIRTLLEAGKSVSNSSEASFESDSTLADFYGAWMTELKDDYMQVFRRASGELRTFRVKGREEVQGRDCFVVERKRLMPSKQMVESTMWIDAERRVVLRLAKGKQVMRLVR